MKNFIITILTILGCLGLAMASSNDMFSVTIGVLMFCGSASVGLGIVE